MPMQWDDSFQGGFTISNDPWMKVNPYYKEVNAASQINKPDSILEFYKRAIKFRRQYNDLMVYGTFELLDMENENTVVYLKGDGDKQAVVALNFTKEKQPFALPQGLKGSAKLAFGNVDGAPQEELQAYEGRVYLVNA